MAEGFIFNHNNCVACGACSAACVLENKWTISPRTVYTYNSPVLPAFPVLNLSLACSHCKTALCLEGCPSSAYYRETVTGAVVIDDTKCIGCRYCQWNCPYDAPKYSPEDRVIGKCNLCYLRVKDGWMPACSTACPTGALAYGSLIRQEASERVAWFPDKGLEPFVELKGSSRSPLRIIPESRFDPEPDLILKKAALIDKEWSLIAFSFLTALSVARLISSLVEGNFPDPLQFLLLIVFAALFSLLHLGKKNRAWRAALNLRSSPLSREIGLFILYSVSAVSILLYQLPVLLIVTSVTGLFLLIAVDAVYIFADNRKAVFLHSGQTFLSALLMVSFFTGIILPFIFIATIRLTASVWRLKSDRTEHLKFVMRFFRCALLIISGISMITKISYPETGVIILFLSGELLDRMLFYIDFKPLNINRLINNQIIEAEK